MMNSLDHIRTFAAVAELGSLSAASKKLKLTQPTIGRHIDLLEEKLQVSLFVRGREGMKLTQRGLELVESAGAVTRASSDFERHAAGLDSSLKGSLRISANEVLGVMILPRLLKEFMNSYPEIEVEIDISNTAANLLRRDADIAIRMFRPKQNDLVARKLTELPLGLYAHRDYLRHNRQLRTIQDLREHRLIGFDRDPSIIDAAAKMGGKLARSNFQFRTDNIIAHVEAIRAGIGIGITHKGFANAWPDVVRVLPDIILPPLELWLACHMDVRYNKRVRLMMDFLAQHLQSPYDS